MAKISEQNARSQAAILPASVHFASRSKPFWRPKDLTHFAQSVVGKLGHRTTMPGACRLTLSKMASNLDDDICGFTA
jgi:hypothetical protein